MESTDKFLINDTILKSYTGNESEVIIPDGITEIAEGAFQKNEALERVKIPESVSIIGDYSFFKCTSLKNVEIAKGKKHIGWGAFGLCAKIESIVLPEIEEIETNAFQNCFGLKEVSISNVADKISRKAFHGCMNLEKLTVDNDNPNYTSIDNVLYSKDLTTVVYVPYGLKECSIASNVTSIPDGLFCDHNSLEKVEMPETVTYIGEVAFYGCTNLKEIIIPSSVNDFGAETFRMCPNLNKVTLNNHEIKISDKLFDVNTFSSLAGSILPAQLSAAKKKELMPYAAGIYLKKEGVSEEWEAAWLKYIKAQRNKIIDDLLDMPDVLQVMLDNKFLKIEDIQHLTDMASEKSLVDMSAMLLDYQNKTFTAKKAASAMTKKLTVDVTSVSYLKKIWNFEKLEDDTLLIKGYKGELLDVVVPAFIGDNKVTVIGAKAFSPNGSRLTEKVKEMRKNIKTIQLPDTITAIESEAFESCYALEKVDIPDSVTSVGSALFMNCKTIETVIIPDSVKTIGSVHFENCENISKIVLPGMSEIPSSGMLFGTPHGRFQNCKKLTTFEVPEGTKYIPFGFFANSPALQSVKIADSVEIIGPKAFFDCNSLTSVGFPKNLKRIEGRAFEACCYLSDVELPEGLTFIGEKAFALCDSIKILYIPESVVETDGYIANYDVEQEEDWVNFKIMGVPGSYAEDIASSHDVEFIPVKDD